MNKAIQRLLGSRSEYVRAIDEMRTVTDEAIAEIESQLRRIHACRAQLARLEQRLLYAELEREAESDD